MSIIISEELVYKSDMVCFVVLKIYRITSNILHISPVLSTSILREEGKGKGDSKLDMHAF